MMTADVFCADESSCPGGLVRVAGWLCSLVVRGKCHEWRIPGEAEMWSPSPSAGHC